MKHKFSTLLIALFWDWFVGDPPNRFHPVAWMGRGIAWSKRCCRFSAPIVQFGHGVLIVAMGGGAVWSVVHWLERRLRQLPSGLRLLTEAWLLKQTFSVHGLYRATGDVQQALARGDLAEARHWLGWHLVSREVSTLDESEVAAATIESLAENTSDGIIAPWWWYMVGGLPLAFLYRFVNTADAMLGYRDARHEWLGKTAARLDDLLNLIPARLTAMFFVLTSGRSRIRAWRVWRRDARLTASPNAGHPMSAMAGALGVRLEKKDHYTLGAELPPPQPVHLARARRFLLLLTLISAGLALLLVTFSPSHRSKNKCG